MLSKIFFISLSIFIVLYLLRGFGLLTFLPGGVVTIWLPIAVISGLIWGIKKTRRF
ncbi:MAG: hypothetical protein ACFCU5_03435 [Pleurocapsa sp.]